MEIIIWKTSFRPLKICTRAVLEGMFREHGRQACTGIYE